MREQASVRWTEMRWWIILCFTLAGMLSLWSTQALALDPALDIDQYAHSGWKIRDGFTASAVFSFAQTQDGYLWLGTGQGLTRFDGVRNSPWQPPAGTSLPDNRIRVLLTSRDGTLWIGTQGGLASWNGRELHNYPQLDGALINALIEDHEGTVWIGAGLANMGSLCAIRNTAIDCNGSDNSFGAYVGCVHEDGKGALWVVAANGLWRWKPGPPKLYSVPDQVNLKCLSETPTGEILVVTTNGIRQLINEKLEPFPLPPLPSALVPSRLLRDRDGGVWIATRQGLFHVHTDRVDGFGPSDGLSGDQVIDFFEDREGSVWVSTLEGLDRFRLLPAVTYTVRQGLPGVAESVLTSKDGSTWISTTEGLYRWREGRISAYQPRSRSSAAASLAATRSGALGKVLIEGLPQLRTTSLLQDRLGRIWLGSRLGLGYLENGRFISVSGVPVGYIDSIAEDKQGTLWVAHRDAGLLRVPTDLKVEPVKPPNSAKLEEITRLAADPVDGGLWLGYFSGGLIHWVDGAVHTSYSSADGLGKGTANNVRVAADGTVWAATNGGLSRIKDGRIATLNSKSGLQCDAVIASVEDDEGSLWVYTGCGLAHIARPDLEAWIAAVDQGKPAPSVRMSVLDNGDGVRSVVPPGATTSPH